jgi:hypothetical protein
MDVVKNCPVGRPLRLDVGVVDVMPKAVVQTLLEPPTPWAPIRK